MYDTNPRYPHKFSVLRPKRTNGEVVLDDAGNPTYVKVALVPCAMIDGYILRESSGAPIADEPVAEMPCGYRTAQRNTEEMGDVVVNTPVLHTPPFLTPLEYGDVLEITDYERTYRAKVVRKTLFNFGAKVWFDEVHN